MLATIVSQARFTWCLSKGRSVPQSVLRSLTMAALRTWEHRGLDATSVDATLTDLDPELIDDQVKRRFRRQVRLARSHVLAYQDLTDPTTKQPGLAELPITDKAAVRADPTAYCKTDRGAALTFFTSGTTGRPLPVWFSPDELRLYYAMSAVGMLTHNLLAPADRLVMATAMRSVLGNHVTAASASMIAADCELIGQTSPSRMIDYLLASHEVRQRTNSASATVLSAYPSYLAHLVTVARHRDTSIDELGVTRLLVGGEVMSDAMRAHLVSSFGGVELYEGYGMTETFSSSGSVCEQGHLHWEPARSIVEVRAIDEDRFAGAGELGTLVVTPLAPFRTTTIYLRYDTGDVVRALPSEQSCSMRSMPATGPIEGKREYVVRVGRGRPARWVTPREILGVVESMSEVALPARIAMRSVDGRLCLQVLHTKPPSPTLGTRIMDELAAAGVDATVSFVRRVSELDDAVPVRGEVWDAPDARAQAGGA